MRVVGGVATHSEGATIRTPVAAIGLRGGIAIISHSGAKGHTGDPRLRPHVGHVALQRRQVARPATTEVSRPGYGVTVAGLNTASLFPRPGQQPGARAGEWAVDEPRRPKRRGKPAADRQSGSELQRRHAHFARRADPSDRLPGTRQCAHGRERHCGRRRRRGRRTRPRVATAVQKVHPASHFVAHPPNGGGGGGGGEAAAVAEAAAAAVAAEAAEAVGGGGGGGGGGGAAPAPTQLTPWSPPGLSAPARARARCPISPAPSREPADSRSRRSLAIRAAASMPTARRIRPQDNSKLASA